MNTMNVLRLTIENESVNQQTAKKNIQQREMLLLVARLMMVCDSAYRFYLCLFFYTCLREWVIAKDNN